MLKFLILGVGPCGLGAAYHLNRLGHADWQIFERNGHVGGLSASFKDIQGFTWDISGHVLFSHYDYFDRAVMGGFRGTLFANQLILRSLRVVKRNFARRFHRLGGLLKISPLTMLLFAPLVGLGFISRHSDNITMIAKPVKGTNQ